MWPFQQQQQYHPVAVNDEIDLKEPDPASATPSKPHQRRFKNFRIATIIIILLTAVLTTTTIIHLTYPGILNPSPPSNKTTHPQDPKPPKPSSCPKRKEWRTLSPPQQKAYITSVLCLLAIPSTLNPTSNFTAYDDFPYIHAHVGYATHHSAPFLPWHRYFLHIYETTLLTKCSYQGPLVYWDWTQDYTALEASPVFESFGGDGDVDGDVVTGRTGRCVTDGPFAGVRVPFYDVRYQPHCLSRGFRGLDGALGHIDGEEISPEAIEEVLQESRYEDFLAKMESEVHDVIPFGIAGDFETFTAPYDPLFFLHHVQLDRLWWLWQQRQPGKGVDEYGGHRERHSMETASVEDELNYRGLAANVKVREVMDIENGVVCYQY